MVFNAFVLMQLVNQARDWEDGNMITLFLVFTSSYMRTEMQSVMQDG